MREILFRGKRVDNGEWVEGCFIKPNAIYIENDPSGNLGKSSDGKFAIGLDVCLVIPESVGQFTGLLDKNGKKIFEGNLIKVNGVNKSWADDVFHVKYYNGMWTLWVSGINHRYVSFGYFFKTACDNGFFEENCLYVSGSLFEIIGNIHDNPELIGK